MVWLGRPCPVSGDVPVTQDFFYIINATQDHSILYVFRQIHQNQHNWYWWRRRWRWWWWLQQQVEVVRALDSRCQVPQVATVHGRMPPLYIYWCRIASCMIQAVSSFCLLFFSPIFILVLYSLQYSYLLICRHFIYWCQKRQREREERQRRKKSTLDKTSTRNLTSLGKFKLVN